MKAEKSVFYDLERVFNDNTQHVVWIHAASLGEFEQGRPVIESLKKSNFNIKILLTFFSPSGYEVRKNYPIADYICYLPLDTKTNVTRFLEVTKPKIAVLIKYEFWYNYIYQCKQLKIPVISISAIFRSNQIYFRSNSDFYSNILKEIDFFFVQNTLSARQLEKIDIRKYEVVGDTRFDRVKEIVDNIQPNEVVKRFTSGRKAMVLGSIWGSDMDRLADMINDNSIDQCYVLAPHNIDQAHTEEILGYLKVDYIKYSETDQSSTLDQKVLIIDNMGMLSSLYGYGQMAYIGGAFRGALHNTLEAATWGVPIFFGSHRNNVKFQEAEDLVKKGAAITFSKSEEIKSLVLQRLENPKQGQEMGEKAKEYVQSNLGATSRIVEYITEKLS